MHHQVNSRKHWQPPSPGWIKCNYDVSHHQGASVSGMGWIFRNTGGQVLTCGMGQFEGRPSVEEGNVRP